MYSEWLQVMLGEIARKREEHESAERELKERAAEQTSTSASRQANPAEPRTARA